MLCHKEVVYVDYALQRADYLAFGEQQQDSQHLDTAISINVHDANAQASVTHTCMHICESHRILYKPDLYRL